ncbi:MAG: hypothetical protein ACK5N8_01205 [Alphaproteobacteria bacterium]
MNTSGFRKYGEQYPTFSMIEKLCKNNVPVLINDDAHQTSSIAENFDKAEALLINAGCKKRFRF